MNLNFVFGSKEEYQRDLRINKEITLTFSELRQLFEEMRTFLRLNTEIHHGGLHKWQHQSREQS